MSTSTPITQDTSACTATTTTIIPKLCYNTAEAAEALGISCETVRRLVYQGVLPHIEGLDRFIHIPVKALQEFVEQETRWYGARYLEKR